MLVEILYCFTYGTYYSKLTTSLWGVEQQQQRMRVFAEAVQTFKTLGKTRQEDLAKESCCHYRD